MAALMAGSPGPVGKFWPVNGLKLGDWRDAWDWKELLSIRANSSMPGMTDGAAEEAGTTFAGMAVVVVIVAVEVVVG